MRKAKFSGNCKKKDNILDEEEPTFLCLLIHKFFKFLIRTMTKHPKVAIHIAHTVIQGLS